jgi:F1F0 ATPase subunit 2
MDAPAMMLPAAYDLAGGIALGLIAGGVVGIVHFVSLNWTVRCFASGLALRAAVLQIGRLGFVAAAFTALALLGAGPLIAGLVGLLAARQVVLRRQRDAP